MKNCIIRFIHNDRNDDYVFGNTYIIICSPEHYDNDNNSKIQYFRIICRNDFIFKLCCFFKNEVKQIRLNFTNRLMNQLIRIVIVNIWRMVSFALFIMTGIMIMSSGTPPSCSLCQLSNLWRMILKATYDLM